MLYDDVSPPAQHLYKKYRNYVRYRTLELVREMIGALPGPVAEAGVCNGEFAFMINHCFPDRTLYLYDIFEADTKAIQQPKIPLFDTISLIKERCPHPEKLVFRKGFFPKSAALEEQEKFAFVSIDFDDQEAYYAGLEFFYPRLQEGGVIFLHVCNAAYKSNPFSPGKEALERYEASFGRLRKVPIPDRVGTIVIVK
jgi:hypothetical protein